MGNFHDKVTSSTEITDTIRLTSIAGQKIVVRRYVWILSLLTGVFFSRVLAQFLQIWEVSDVLPSFEAWHSGAVPYGMLFLAQCLILFLCVRIIWKIREGDSLGSYRKGLTLLVIGCLYVLVMAFRLVVGIFWAPDHYWFGAILPTVFHLVLAGFILGYGHFHYSIGLANIRKDTEA